MKDLKTIIESKTQYDICKEKFEKYLFGSYRKLPEADTEYESNVFIALQNFIEHNINTQKFEKYIEQLFDCKKQYDILQTNKIKTIYRGITIDKNEKEVLYKQLVSSVINENFTLESKHRGILYYGGKALYSNHRKIESWTINEKIAWDFIDDYSYNFSTFIAYDINDYIQDLKKYINRFGYVENNMMNIYQYLLEDIFDNLTYKYIKTDKYFAVYEYKNVKQSEILFDYEFFNKMAKSSGISRNEYEVLRILPKKQMKTEVLMWIPSLLYYAILYHEKFNSDIPKFYEYLQKNVDSSLPDLRILEEK